jgi:glycosyltransferase involved in cell wall biosynthesis
MSTISVVINCTESEIQELDKCLNTLKNFANEIIIVDMEAGKGLISLQKKYNFKIFPHPLLPVVEPARNFGISKAKSNWVLILDADERLTPGLRGELLKIANRDDIDYVKIPRKNIIFNKWLRHTGCWSFKLKQSSIMNL